MLGIDDMATFQQLFLWLVTLSVPLVIGPSAQPAVTPEEAGGTEETPREAEDAEDAEGTFINWTIGAVVVGLSLLAGIVVWLFMSMHVHRLKSSSNKEAVIALSGRKTHEMLLKLKTTWEVKQTTITLIEEVGEGSFGTTWKATCTLQGQTEEAQQVAVKTIHHASCNTEYVIGVLSEALLMGGLRHPNVLGVLGVTTGGSLPLLVLPFMDHGNLKSYLLSFQIQGGGRGMKKEAQVVKKAPTIVQLLVFGLHIANGMAYLAEQHIVHRDLVCKNCMLNSRLVVKVAGFGLAKDVSETSNYRQETKLTKLSLKWLAIESLTDKIFTSESDVWSFGVTLWEILTMASTLYQSLEGSEVLQHIQDGDRLAQPSVCPDEIFFVMKQCWSASPSERPTFVEIKERLDLYLSVVMGYLPLDDGVTERADEPRDDPRPHVYYAIRGGACVDG